MSGTKSFMTQVEDVKVSGGELFFGCGVSINVYVTSDGRYDLYVFDLLKVRHAQLGVRESVLADTIIALAT